MPSKKKTFVTLPIHWTDYIPAFILALVMSIYRHAPDYPFEWVASDAALYLCTTVLGIGSLRKQRTAKRREEANSATHPHKGYTP
ncbi:MAG: hypothetical protein OXT67_09150 [Zetaproteobacteria bacterium]|nr:hypothetical protein [Zetaproteobacteria bacterium]